jgi:hypothetical protein
MACGYSYGKVSLLSLRFRNQSAHQVVLNGRSMPIAIAIAFIGQASF